MKALFYGLAGFVVGGLITTDNEEVQAQFRKVKDWWKGLTEPEASH